MTIDGGRAESFLPRSGLAILACINPDSLRCIWPVAKPLLRRATLRPGLCAFADIVQKILVGNALLWLALSGTRDDVTIDAVATTRLELTDAGKVCVITTNAGGD